MKEVDVAIIGGSLAGSACARYLAQFGVEAAAFERDPFPREKVCGGFISPGSVAALEQLGLLDALRRAGAVEIRRACIRVPGDTLDLTFDTPGLGVSRRTLDAALADHPAVRTGSVRAVRREGNRFRLRLDEGEIQSRIVIDASGKLTRFAGLRKSDQFGVQYYAPAPRADVLDFWFFADGYGGAVTVEGGRSNACFLIRKDALPRYLGKDGCRVTGPMAYGPAKRDLIAVGDAAGMVDPFCGEGIHHALDTGRLAACVVSEGFRRGWSYEKMRRDYEAAHRSNWAARRALAAIIRRIVARPQVMAAALRWRPEQSIGYFLKLFWRTA